MNPRSVNLAIEDELSEATLKRLLRHVGRYAVGRCYRRGGYGYLRRTIRGWNAAAQGTPLVVLTDLDRNSCPAALLEEWLGEPKHENLVFRVAVREVEAWLLADWEGLARYFRVRRRAAEWSAADDVTDPKAAVIRLAREARSELRERVVPRAGSTALQGPDYNGGLVPFVEHGWNIAAAAERPPSLARTVARLRGFEPVWPPETGIGGIR